MILPGKTTTQFINLFDRINRIDRIIKTEKNQIHG